MKRYNGLFDKLQNCYPELFENDFKCVRMSRCSSDTFKKGVVKKKMHQQPQKRSFFVAVGAIFFTAPLCKPW